MMKKNHGICNFFLGGVILFTCVCFAPARFVPPGTINDKSSNLFVDKTEILNKHWTEYLIYISNSSGENSIEYNSALPDSSIWNEVYPSSEIRRYYSTYADYPVIGISYEQAENFCKWRSERVSEKYKKNVTYRLPSKTEWETIEAGLSKSKKIQHERKLIKIQSSKGITNMYDSVSEMISEKGIAKGASWCDEIPLDQSQSKDVNYSKPSKCIGFRCVATVN